MSKREESVKRNNLSSVMKSSHGAMPKYSTTNYSHKTLDAIANELIQECKTCNIASNLSKTLRDKLTK